MQIWQIKLTIFIINYFQNGIAKETIDQAQRQMSEAEVPKFEIERSEYIFEEVTNFCQNNGHKFLGLLENKQLNQLKKYFLKINSLKNLKSRIIFDNSSKLNMDTLIITIMNKNIDFQSIFEVINQHKIQKSILVLLNHIKIQNVVGWAEKFTQNSYFYVLEPRSNIESNWYNIMTFYGSSKIIMNEIQFHSNGKIIENYNLNEFKIVATSLPWLPFTGKNLFYASRKFLKLIIKKFEPKISDIGDEI